MGECYINFRGGKKKFSYCKKGTKCSVEGCDNPIFCKGYCTKHYAQIQHHGAITTTIFDKNEIIEHEDYAEIIVRNKQGDIKGKAIIDLDDVERCRRFRWGMYANGYFYGNINKTFRIRLHRFILGLNAWDKSNEVDHINRNKADNRKTNIKIVNHSDNNKNKKPNYSKTVNTNNDNVYFDKRYNSYYGRYGFKGCTYTTNYYKNREDALDAINEIKRNLMKESNIIYSFT